MRLFIAVELPAAHCAQLNTLSHLLKSSAAEVSLASEFHPTLKFLGDYPDNNLHDLKERLSHILFAPFEAKLGAIGVFPNKQHVRVVWIGAEPAEKFAALAEQIDCATPELRKDHAAFVPHITLCRVKAVNNKQLFAETIKHISIDQNQFAVNTFTLFKSTLGQKGAVHELIATFSQRL